MLLCTINIDRTSAFIYSLCIFSEALKIVKDRFEPYAIGMQDFAGNDERRAKLLSLVPDSDILSSDA